MLKAVRISLIGSVTLFLVYSVAFVDTTHGQTGTLVPYDAPTQVTSPSAGFHGASTPNFPPVIGNPGPFGVANNPNDVGWIMNSVNEIFTVDFRTPQAINSFRAYSVYDGAARGGEWLVEHSDDGNNFSSTDGGPVQYTTMDNGGVDDVGDPMGPGNFGGWYEYTFNLTSHRHQYWRLSETGAGIVQGHSPRTGEVEFYSQSFVPSDVLEWRLNDAGSWADSGNWTPGGGPPGLTTQTARFGTHANITGPTTAVTNSAVTVNRVEFENATHNYAVAGLGSVNLLTNTTTAASPSIGVLAGDHEFQVRVNLQDDTFLSVASDSSLDFNHKLSLDGNTLIKTGEGTVVFNNNLVSGGGGSVSCEQGNCIGTGTIAGDLNNGGGTVSPGNLSAVASVPEPSSVVLLTSGLALASLLGNLGHSVRR